MMILLWMLIALVVLDIVAHLQHITMMDALRKDVAWLRTKLTGGST